MAAKLEQGAYTGAPLHFIGHLQRNKVRQVVGRVELIHSAGSLELLEENHSRSGGNRVLKIIAHSHGQIFKSIIVQISAYVNIKLGNFYEIRQISMRFPLHRRNCHQPADTDVGKCPGPLSRWVKLLGRVRT